MEVISIYGKREILDEIDIKIKDLNAGQATVMEKKNLSGEAATWVLVANLAITAMPHVITYLKGKKVTKIKYGELEIENPTPEMIAELYPLIKDKLQQNPDASANG